MIHERSYRLDETGAGYRDIYYLDEKGYPVDAPQAVFRMSCKRTLLSGIICNICGIVYEEALSWNYPSSSKK